MGGGGASISIEGSIVLQHRMVRARLPLRLVRESG